MNAISYITLDFFPRLNSSAELPLCGAYNKSLTLFILPTSSPTFTVSKRKGFLSVRPPLTHIYPRLMKVETNSSLADLWVIALAMQHQDGIVVTEEQPAGNLSNPKIPDVCKDLGIECVNVAGFVSKEN